MMDENIQLFNIPLIFTQYRTKVLEESGKKWFHASNNQDRHVIGMPADTEIGVSGLEGASATQLNAPIDSSMKASQQTEKTLVAVQSDQSLQYEYPDPWHSSAAEPLSPQKNDPAHLQFEDLNTVEMAFDNAALNSEPHCQRPNLEALNPPLPVNDGDNQLVTNQAASTSTSDLHPANNVNLFPLGEETAQTEGFEGQYDLTEFDNGEIEIPPEAVRDSSHSTFEKVKQAPASKGEDPDDEATLDNSNENSQPRYKDSRPKPSSAEIAKYRLRNCL